MSAPKAPTRIINRGNGHSYLLDGEPCPGVTTIIKNGKPMPALTGWAARTVAEYVVDRLDAANDGHVYADALIADLRAWNLTRGNFSVRLGERFSRGDFGKILGAVQWADRDTAAAKGTEIHGYAERLAGGEEVQVPDHAAGHVDAYLRFLEEWQPVDAVSELVVVSRRWRYMGKLDLIATLPRVTLPDGTPWGGRTLLDYKTGLKGPFPDDVFQLAAYRYAEEYIVDPATGETAPLEPVDSAGVVKIRADGYDVYPYRADEAAWRIFLYMAQVSAFLDRDAERGVGTVLGPAITPPAHK